MKVRQFQICTVNAIMYLVLLALIAPVFWSVIGGLGGKEPEWGWFGDIMGWWSRTVFGVLP